MSRDDYLFSSGDLRATLVGHEQKMGEAAGSIPADRALARSTAELVAELVDEYRIAPLDIDWSGVTVAHSDVKVDVSHDPRRFISRPGPFYILGTEVTYHVPFRGDPMLFRVAPPTRTSVLPTGSVSGRELLLTATVPADSIDRVKGELDREIELVKKYAGWVNETVDEWNGRLEGNVRAAVDRRRAKVIADRDLVASLGVPVRRREEAVPTYAVAPVRRQATQTRSSAGRPASAPEPFLAAEEYEHILDIARGMVGVMERSPKSFARMDEEALRDHFLVQLNGQYQGSATGETFNFEGKTDILVRERGKNLFIGECKFWAGPAKLTETIDQLLGYTSWRDTKTAIFVFNRRRDLTRVLAQISPTVSGHPNFVREINYGGETDFRFVLHHRDDRERELTLSVLVFEVPGPKSEG